MSEQNRPALDAFSFSLGGMSVIPGFVALPLIANYRIRKRIDESREEPRESASGDASPGSDALQIEGRHAA